MLLTKKGPFTGATRLGEGRRGECSDGSSSSGALERWE